ncbi:uncharacterized protein LOC144359208 [Saccoglossus kowalevskii]
MSSLDNVQCDPGYFSNGLGQCSSCTICSEVSRPPSGCSLCDFPTSTAGSLSASSTNLQVLGLNGHHYQPVSAVWTLCVQWAPVAIVTIFLSCFGVILWWSLRHHRRTTEHKSHPPSYSKSENLKLSSRGTCIEVVPGKDVPSEGVAYSGCSLRVDIDGTSDDVKTTITNEHLSGPENERSIHATATTKDSSCRRSKILFGDSSSDVSDGSPSTILEIGEDDEADNETRREIVDNIVGSDNGVHLDNDVHCIDGHDLTALETTI